MVAMIHDMATKMKATHMLFDLVLDLLFDYAGAVHIDISARSAARCLIMYLQVCLEQALCFNGR